MFGLEPGADIELPSWEYTLGLFTSLGTAHGILMNLLRSKPALHKPLWIVYRGVCGMGFGALVHNVAPHFKRVRKAKLEYDQKMVEWEEGVLKRRQMEREMLAKLK